MYNVSDEYKKAVTLNTITSNVKLKIINATENEEEKRIYELLKQIELVVDFNNKTISSKIPKELEGKISFYLDENNNICGQLDETLQKIVAFRLTENRQVELIIKNNMIIDSNNIITLKLKDYCNDNGNIIGTAMLKELEVELKNKEGYNLSGQILDFQYGLKIGDSYEYVPYGRYIVQSFEDLKSSNKYKMICNDLMCKLNADFDHSGFFIEGMTLWEYYKGLCNFYGMEYEDQSNELPNTEFIVHTAPVFEGKSGRIAISRIAEMFGSFVKVNRNNKLQFYLVTDTTEKIDNKDVNSKLEINNIPNRINGVSLELGNGVEGENVVKKEPNISKDDEHFIRIIDNPFVWNQELREIAIEGLYNRLVGFEYTPFNLGYKGRFYYDCGDKIQIQNTDGTYVNSIICNQYFEVPATRKSTIDTEALSKSELKYQYQTKTEQANAHTELIVNKHEKTINSLITEVTGLNEKTTSIEQDLDSIETLVKRVADITNNASGLNPLTLENCMEGEIQLLKIKGNNEVFSENSVIKVYSPNLKTTPSDTYIDENGVFQKNPSSQYGNIIIELDDLKSYKIKSSAGAIYCIATYSINPINYESENPLESKQFELIEDSETEREFIPQERYLVLCYFKDEYDVAYDSIVIQRNDQTIDLGIKNKLNLYDAEIYDEFIYDANININKKEDEELEPKAKVIRRVGVNEDGTLYPLVIPKEEPLDIEDIYLTKNTNIIDIVNYSALITAEFVILNDFTTKFASVYQVQTSIKQLANSILLIAQEMVGKEEVLSSINVAIKDGLGVLEIINNSMIIDSDNFKMKADGTITITANINEKYKYSHADIYLALLHIKGTITLPNELVELYRCVSTAPNKITVSDVIKMEAIANGTAEPIKDIAGTLSIDPSDTEKGISFNLNSDKNSDLQTIIGLYQIYTYMIKGTYLYLGSGYSEELNEMAYGIHLDGLKKMLRIVDVANSVGTILDSGKIDTYNLYGANGGAKGKAMHSPDVEFGGNDHDYICHYTGSALVFNIDSRTGTDFNVGPFWINTSSSDRNLKEDIKSIDDNILKVINEIELKQFIYKNDEEGKIFFGIIAQELIEICKKYNVDIFKYNIIKQGAFIPNDENLYYAIDKTELLMLKTKCLENKIKKIDELEKKIEQLRYI